MSRFKTKQELLDEAVKWRKKLDDLLDEIPDDKKTVEVSDGMSVKDFIAHRTEWGRMMIRWYTDAKQGKTPAVPTEKYKWNQLKELNAEILKDNKGKPLKQVMSEFREVQDKLAKLMNGATEKELLENNIYKFTGVSDLATYFNSASGSHYHSAYRIINKWWKSQS